jgi:mitochondrial intermediate peptidase
LYLDLYPRYGKFGHAAHFTVRCGCVSNTDPDQIKMNTSNKTQNYQHPIVALVCNFTSVTQTSSSSTTDYDDILLSHSDVVTLFHEFGHALHSLLSRTKFQHLAGTRGALDFTETPSHWMENFAWDKVFLRTVLAKHYITGESLPEPIIDVLGKSRNSFNSIEKQNQLLYSLFDQSIFFIPDESVSTMQIWKKHHEQLNMPYSQSTHWYTRFGHLTNYGASYYVYLYAQVFSSKIWDQHFNSALSSSIDNGSIPRIVGGGEQYMQRPLNRQAGELLWKKVLMFGGSKDPNEMLNDILIP